MPNQPHVVKFVVFEVDLTAGEVRKAGMEQKLAGQPFQVLQALLERPQEIVTREELRERIWPGNILVDYELALKKPVNRLREVLGDSADRPHFNGFGLVQAGSGPGGRWSKIQPPARQALSETI